MRSMLSFPFFYFTLLLIACARAAFTTNSSWALDIIRADESGTICYYPTPHQDVACSDTESVVAGPLNAHLGQAIGNALSIGYYSPIGTLLGGAAWPVPVPVDPAFPVCVCMSGRSSDSRYYTRCRFALHDDDMDDPRAEELSCVVARAPLTVIDGCYPPLSAPAPSTTGLSPTNDTTRLDSPNLFTSSTPSILALLPPVLGIVSALLALGVLVYPQVAAAVKARSARMARAAVQPDAHDGMELSALEEGIGASTPSAASDSTPPGAES